MHGKIVGRIAVSDLARIAEGPNCGDISHLDHQVADADGVPGAFCGPCTGARPPSLRLGLHPIHREPRVLAPLRRRWLPVGAGPETATTPIAGPGQPGRQACGWGFTPFTGSRGCWHRFAADGYQLVLGRRQAARGEKDTSPGSWARRASSPAATRSKASNRSPPHRQSRQTAVAGAKRPGAKKTPPPAPGLAEPAAQPQPEAKPATRWPPSTLNRPEQLNTIVPPMPDETRGRLSGWPSTRFPDAAVHDGRAGGHHPRSTARNSSTPSSRPCPTRLEAAYRVGRAHSRSGPATGYSAGPTLCSRPPR